MTHSIATAVDSLNHAFEDFKNHHGEELQELKAQSSQVVDLDVKMSRATERLNRLEVALKRPGQESAPSYPGSHGFQDPALSNFLRKGIEDGFLNKKSLTSEKDNSGGFLISHPTMEMVNKRLGNLSIIRQLARITTISTDSLDLVVEGKNGVVGWVSETGDRAETDTPELIRVRVPVHQIYAKPKISQKLLDDAFINVEEWLARRLSEGMSVIENRAFIFGDGDGKPKGILSYGTQELGEGEWGKFETLNCGEDGKITADLLIELVHSLKTHYLAGSSWLMSRSAATAIRKLKDEQGAYIWQQSLSSEMPNTLVGYPVFLCDDMPEYKIDQKTPSIIFGNFKEAYQIADRAQIHVLRDPYSSKPYVEFYATKRVGGDVINFDALRILITGKE